MACLGSSAGLAYTDACCVSFKAWAAETAFLGVLLHESSLKALPVCHEPMPSICHLMSVAWARSASPPRTRQQMLYDGSRAWVHARLASLAVQVQQRARHLLEHHAPGTGRVWAFLQAATCMWRVHPWIASSSRLPAAGLASPSWGCYGLPRQLAKSSDGAAACCGLLGLARPSIHDCVSSFSSLQLVGPFP